MLRSQRALAAGSVAAVIPARNTQCTGVSGGRAETEPQTVAVHHPLGAIALNIEEIARHTEVVADEQRPELPKEQPWSGFCNNRRQTRGRSAGGMPWATKDRKRLFCFLHGQQ